MVTKREYLAGLGLAKADGRGRFSLKAQEALVKAIASGMTFSTPVATSTPRIVKEKVVVKRGAEAPQKHSKQREETIIYGIDKGVKPGQQDLVLAFDHCAGCSKPIQFCTHDEPKLPKWLDSSVYWTKP